MKTYPKPVKRQPKKSTVPVAFPIAPEPFEDESCISWVQRLCGEHHCNYLALEKLIEFKPTHHDWDDLMGARDWSRLALLCGFKSQPCRVGNARNESVWLVLDRATWLRFTNKSPSYKWCALCWRDDAVPYLRWSWRWKKVTTCNVHRVKLTEFCPWCSSPMILKRALLTKSGSYAGVSNLSYCGTCGMHMADSSIDTGAVGERTERDFYLDSWGFLQEQEIKIRAQIEVVQINESKLPKAKRPSNDDLLLLKRRLERTKKAARIFIDKFFSDDEASP
jgi:hypothetical protein